MSSYNSFYTDSSQMSYGGWTNSYKYKEFVYCCNKKIDISEYAKIKGTNQKEELNGDQAGEPMSDAIKGKGGDDNIDAKGGSDYVDAGYGNDFVRGGDGDDCLHGNCGSDIILGEGGKDFINGAGGKSAYHHCKVCTEKCNVLIGDSVGGAQPQNVVIIIDLSKSMENQFGDSGKSRIEVVEEALIDVADELGDQLDDGAMKLFFVPFGEGVGLGPTYTEDPNFGIYTLAGFDQDGDLTGYFNTLPDQAGNSNRTNFNEPLHFAELWLQSDEDNPVAWFANNDASYIYQDEMVYTPAPNSEDGDFKREVLKYEPNDSAGLAPFANSDNKIIFLSDGAGFLNENLEDDFPFLFDPNTNNAIIQSFLINDEVPVGNNLNLIDSDGEATLISSAEEISAFINAITAPTPAHDEDIIYGTYGTDFMIGDSLVGTVVDTSLEPDELKAAIAVYVKEIINPNHESFDENEFAQQVAADGSDDVLHGKGGRDIILAQGGNDSVYAGRGHDKVYAGNGRDESYGGKGHDVLVGGQDSDRSFGSAGKDKFIVNFDEEQDQADHLGIWDDDAPESVIATDFVNGGKHFDTLKIQSGANVEHYTLQELINGGTGLSIETYLKDELSAWQGKHANNQDTFVVVETTLVNEVDAFKVVFATDVEDTIIL